MYLKLGCTTKLSCKKIYISRSPSASLVTVGQYFLYFHSWFMKNAHLNSMTRNAEFLAFFNSFPTNISNLELDFEKLTNGDTFQYHLNSKFKLRIMTLAAFGVYFKSEKTFKVYLEWFREINYVVCLNGTPKMLLISNTHCMK